MDYDARIFRAVQPTLSRGGQITIVSTPNGQDNVFYLLWSGDEGGDWSRHRIHWRDCPAFDDAWYARERPRYTEQAWASEYECDFAASGDAVFRPDDIDAMSVGAVGLKPPEPGRDYYAAWDIGRRRDATVGVVLDVTDVPAQIVAYQRRLRLPYPAIQSLIDETAKHYRGRVRVESSGIGDPTIENLSVYVERFQTTGPSKVRILQRLQMALERGLVKAAGVPQLVSELRGYRWEDAHIVQDSVIALALAVDAAWLRVQAGTGERPDTLPEQPDAPGRMSARALGAPAAPAVLGGTGGRSRSRWTDLPGVRRLGERVRWD